MIVKRLERLDAQEKRYLYIYQSTQFFIESFREIETAHLTDNKIRYESCSMKFKESNEKYKSDMKL